MPDLLLLIIQQSLRLKQLEYKNKKEREKEERKKKKGKKEDHSSIKGDTQINQ